MAKPFSIMIHVKRTRVIISNFLYLGKFFLGSYKEIVPQKPSFSEKTRFLFVFHSFRKSRLSGGSERAESRCIETRTLDESGPILSFLANGSTYYASRFTFYVFLHPTNQRLIHPIPNFLNPFRRPFVEPLARLDTQFVTFNHLTK